MTQEEIDAIVQQVVQALLTNGKTIAQLTAVQEVEDGDFLELSGGRKVSYGVLAGAIIDSIGSITNYTVVDYDGRDEVVTLTYTKSNGVITLKQSGHSAKTITISTATTSRPGLMSAADKTNLTTALNRGVSGFSGVPSQNNVSLTLSFIGGTSLTYTLPAATMSVAGVMTPADKTKLESAKSIADTLNSKIGAANGIATLDANGKLAAEQVPSTVVTNNDIVDKANLVEGVRMLTPDEWPSIVLFNVGVEDTENAEAGDVIFVRRQQGNVNIARLYYLTSGGDSISLGEPVSNAVYCHKSTGIQYRWDNTNLVFVPVGMQPQVLKSMGSSIDNAGASTQWVYSPYVGDFYFDAGQGKIMYKKSADVLLDLGEPSGRLIYCNYHTNKMYKWNGSTFVVLG